jgi:hypothetical protein
VRTSTHCDRRLVTFRCGVSCALLDQPSCTDHRLTLLGTDIRYREECVGTFLTTEGVEQERVWKASSTANFDNLGKAMQTTFEVATLEMWPVYMGFGVDARGQDEAILPDSESSPFLATYFVLVVMVFGFFIVNLFVGIVTDTFNTYKVRAKLFTSFQVGQPEF